MISDVFILNQLSAILPLLIQMDGLLLSIAYLIIFLLKFYLILDILIISIAYNTFLQKNLILYMMRDNR
jgi:hypothetical protein